MYQIECWNDYDHPYSWSHEGDFTDPHKARDRFDELKETYPNRSFRLIEVILETD